MTEGSKHRWIVDSIEEDSAAIEVDGTRIMFVPLFVLPVDAREGDVLLVSHVRTGNSSRIEIEMDEAGKRDLLERSRRQAETRQGKDAGGNIRL